MSKIEAGRIKIKSEFMDLNRLLDDVRAIFQFVCQRKKLSLTIDTVELISNRIVADRGKIRQVLINLLSNAVKFTRRGGITLRAETKSEGERERTVIFDVIDTGSGIAPVEQGNLFEAFEQTTSGQRVSEGTGL